MEEEEERIHAELDRMMARSAGKEVHMQSQEWVKELRRCIHLRIDAGAWEHKPVYNSVLRWLSKNVPTKR